MSQTKYGDISQRTAAWAATEMLDHAEPILVLTKFGQNKPIPKNKADNVKFRRPVPYAPAMTPIVEGVTPTAKKMAYVDVPAILSQYGDVTEISDKVHDTAEDSVLKDASMMLGEQAAETMEMVTWGVLQGGTTVFYGAPSDGARNEVNDPVSLNRVRAVTRALKAARGRPVTMMLNASPNYGTVPVEGGYICFAHTDCDADIRGLPGFVTLSEYGSRKPLCPEELGSVENVRFITTPLLEPIENAGAADLNGMLSSRGLAVNVYPMVFIAKEAYGLVPLKGEGSITPSVINPGTISKSDPLGQRGYVGWKTYFTAVRLNEAWMARLEVGVTDL